MDAPLIDNQEAKQYAMHIESMTARIEYIKAQQNIYLTHTDISIQFEGRGIGSLIVKKALF